MPQRPRAPHLNVVIFCSLLRVHKHLEASLTNIEMGVPGALMETVGSKIPSSVVAQFLHVRGDTPTRPRIPLVVIAYSMTSQLRWLS